MIKQASPLKWPTHLPITPPMLQGVDNGFSPNITLSDALRFLDDEVSVPAFKSATLYSDYEHIATERLRKKIGGSVGVALYMKTIDREYIVACDKWKKIEHNVYALSLAVRNFTQMEKWGVCDIAKAMAGFGANRKEDVIVEKSERVQERRGDSSVECLTKFGLSEYATLEDAIAIYHRRAKFFSDDSEALVELNLAMEQVRKHFAQNTGATY